MIAPLTNEDEWRSQFLSLPQWEPPRVPTLIVVPHPDDETLGAGGLIARLRSSGIEITIVAVTDGEHAYPDTEHLGKVREQEQNAALGRLGVGSEQVHRLRFTDSGVAASEERLKDVLLTLVASDMHVVSPWQKDFHPDHEACGRAAEAVARLKKTKLTSYFFWTWHRGTPALLDGLRLVALTLTERERRAKYDALMCHQSQLKHASGSPILPENLLEPAVRPFEVYLPS
jgi:LmbE family N-acetylglucosaminyl deacetylase